MKKVPLVLIALAIVVLVLFATYPGSFFCARVLETLGASGAASEIYSRIQSGSPESRWAQWSELGEQRISTSLATPTAAPTAVSTPQTAPEPGLAAVPQSPTPPAEKRVDPSYGGPLGAYWHTKNKINDIQKQRNDDMMKQLQE